MRVHVTDAKPGDRLKSDTYNGHGVPVMIQGTELQHDDISKLIMHGVDYIDIDAGSASIPVDFAPMFQLPLNPSNAPFPSWSRRSVALKACFSKLPQLENLMNIELMNCSALSFQSWLVKKMSYLCC